MRVTCLLLCQAFWQGDSVHAPVQSTPPATNLVPTNPPYQVGVLTNAEVVCSGLRCACTTYVLQSPSS